jgi:hypothetical protein
METYDKVLNNISNILSKNKEQYEATRAIFHKSPSVTVAKFNQLIQDIHDDIQNNRVSKNVDFTEQEELNLFTLVLYYRLIRNLVSIECLLEYANPDSDHFDCVEYSVGILLRANLLDCKLLYRSRTTKDINKYHIDAFNNFLKNFRWKHKILENQKTQQLTEDTARVGREVEFCQRIINCLSRNSVKDMPELDPTKFSNEISFFVNIEKDCNELYDVYSKYDHFSLYEISKLHWDRPKRIEAMHQALLLQTPALHICYAVLGGVELTSENVAAIGSWLEGGLEM